MDYRQEAIKINDELIGALNGQLTFHNLIRKVCPAEAYTLAFDNVRGNINKIEDRIKQAKARKQNLEEVKS